MSPFPSRKCHKTTTGCFGTRRSRISKNRSILRKLSIISMLWVDPVDPFQSVPGLTWAVPHFCPFLQKCPVCRALNSTTISVVGVTKSLSWLPILQMQCQRSILKQNMFLSFNFVSRQRWWPHLSIPRRVDKARSRISKNVCPADLSSKLCDDTIWCVPHVCFTLKNSRLAVDETV